MKLIKQTVLASFVISLVPSLASANIIWDWSFDNTSGQFVTDGDDPTLNGNYTMIDFSLTATDTGATIGSVSGGQYSASGFSTTTSYSMVWDGGSVTEWQSAGSNIFNWWVFDDLAASRAYIFCGWETDNINTADQAVYWTGNNLAPSSTLTIAAAAAPQAVPEPGTLALLGIGLLSLLWRRATWNLRG